MERILISACLLGQPVRYNGTDKPSGHDPILTRWQEDGRLVPICPELVAGFATPRPPAEITEQGEGDDVLAGRARVIEATGNDVTALYLRAAERTVALAVRHGCRHAVLTDGSPSCGSSFIYDGTFTGQTQPGAGATTAALRSAGIAVWSEAQIALLDAKLTADPPP